ncbi:MAG TPA: phosphatase [Candidatus Monoglobus merdigallinarum]|uniref:Phosphatase n=1 Tax=Candidatus Monoglobus merdigallinarum TaxID=2838698 RepID=A0A9D1TM46_9FIRM|nr:phosphatase [Candidatus Monoglobus merdigallinarum]
MNILVDTHTHTSCSSHAFGTIWENMRCASERGLEAVCMTNHAPAMPDSPHLWHFTTMYELPDYIEGVRLLKGCEANVMDPGGRLDMDDGYLKKMDVVVASIHPPCYDGSGLDDHTETWINVLKNPYVNIIGHSGDPRYPYDIDKVVRCAKEYNKCIELNNHSHSVRVKSIKNCEMIARKCMEVGCFVAVSSDAHTPFDVGNFDEVKKMLRQIGFPKKLIINTTREKFIEYLNSAGRDIML